MLLITEASYLYSEHQTGRVSFRIPRGPRSLIDPTQDFVYIMGDRVVTNPSLHGHTIQGCKWWPQGDPNGRCKHAIPSGPITGPSSLVFISGMPVILDNVEGITDSVPPARYSRKDARQSLVDSVS